MSDSIFRIWSIARYEAKVIMRGWLFRIAMLLPVAFLAVLMFTSIFNSHFMWNLVSGFVQVPSTMPWIMTVFYTVYSCIVLGAVATASGWRVWRLDTLDGVRARSWSNLEEATGKSAGQLFCFLIMTGAVLLAVIGVGLLTPGLLVFWTGFLIYPFIICLPAFVFVIGLSMLISRVVRNQMLSMMVVTVVILFSILTADRLFHLFDITAMRLPLFFSSVTGFSFPELIARQRILFLGAGIMMIFLTSVLTVRPPGRRSAPFLTAVTALLALAIGFLAAVGYAGYFSEGAELRKMIREISSEMRPLPRLTPLEYTIDVVQEGRVIDCTALVVLENRSDTPVARYMLSLNPGLVVSSVSSDAVELDYKQDVHLLSVSPPSVLEPGELDTIEVRYSGIIDGRAMFSDVPEEVRGRDNSFREMFSMGVVMSGLNIFRVRRDIAPARYDYILLVPEAMWYPVPRLPYDFRYPEEDYRDFCRFRVKVRPNDELIAVSQGEQTAIEDGSYLFEPEYPLKGITLAIGDFTIRTTAVDSIQYQLISTPGSKDLFGMLECAADTIPSLIGQMRDRFEYSLGLDYPFKRLIFLEVPASFGPFNRSLRETGSGYAQPEIFLFHERGMSLGLSGVPSWLEIERKYIKEGRSPEEMERMSVARSVSWLMGSLRMDRTYNIFPMYYGHSVDIEPSGIPCLGLMFEYMAGEAAISHERRRQYTEDRVTDSERSSALIAQGRLMESVVEPEGYRWAGNMVASWAAHHYYMIEAMTEEGAAGRFLREFVEANRFRSTGEEEFLDLFTENLGFRLESILVEMDNPVDIPGYIYGGFDCCEIVEGEIKKYRASFDLVNFEGIRGVVVVRAALKYPRKMQIGRRRMLKNPVYAIESLGPGESKRVEIDFDYPPITIWVNTMISRNIPSKITWGPGVEVRGKCGGKKAQGIGINLLDFEKGSIVIDDRDPGFETSGGGGGILKRFFSSTDDTAGYINVRGTHKDPPAKWSCVLEENFFGRYVRSARCIRAGEGNAKAVWRAVIPEDGYYDIYCYIYDRLRKLNPKSRAKYGLDRIEHHYTIHHSDGSAEVVLVPDRCEDGWNLVGRYYFEAGEAAVELSDKSPVLYVIADAVKWVKKD